MARPKANYETKSINRGFRMKPSTLEKLKVISDLTGNKQNGYMELLIEKEYNKLIDNEK